MPEIITVEKMIEIPSDLTVIHEQSIPGHGDNSVLLDVTLQCLVNNRLYTEQMQAIRELQR